jgi:hypothetical protein
VNAPTGKIQASGKVYQKIAEVQGELSKVGIAKNRRNSQQGYNFRGIDEVYAALSPLLASHGLIIVPRILERECVEGQTRKGDPLFRVTVRAEFDFIAAEDGSIHTAATFGEAMDSADKATNKAMSAAYKYAAFMTFAIPTEGDNDADAHTPEAASTRGSGGDKSEARQVSPAGTQAPSFMPDAEFAKLVQLIEATSTDRSKMLAHFKVKDLRFLNQAQYGEAVAKLTADLAAMAKTETNKSFAEELGDAIVF